MDPKQREKELLDRKKKIDALLADPKTAGQGMMEGMALMEDMQRAMTEMIAAALKEGDT
jgi:hypothetical protein